MVEDSVGGGCWGDLMCLSLGGAEDGGRISAAVWMLVGRTCRRGCSGVVVYPFQEVFIAHAECLLQPSRG